MSSRSCSRRFLKSAAFMLPIAAFRCMMSLSASKAASASTLKSVSNWTSPLMGEKFTLLLGLKHGGLDRVAATAQEHSASFCLPPGQHVAPLFQNARLQVHTA